MNLKLKNVAKAVSVLCFAFLLTNCTNDESTDAKPLVAQDEKIKDAEKITDAQKWFSTYKSKSGTGKSADDDFNKVFRNIDYYWENATVVTLEDNTTAVAVPIKDTPEDPEYKGQKMLYLYPSDSKYQSVIQEIFPDSKAEIDDSEKKEGFADLKSFSGFIITWDLKKGFIKGARFKNDTITAIVKDVRMEFDSDAPAKGKSTGKMAPIEDDGYVYGNEDEVVTRGGSAYALNNVIVTQKSPAPSFTPIERYNFNIGGGSDLKDYLNTPTGAGRGGITPPISAPSPAEIAAAIQKQIYADNLPACLKNILNDLVKINAGPGNMIVKFAGEEATGYNWTMLQGANELGVSGNTLSTYNETTGITTTFDIIQYPNATELGWAKTMLHESIHAYLTTYYKLQARGYIGEYPKLFQDWCANGNKDLNKYQHEEIARNLVKYFGDALESYGISKGYNLNKQFYQDMAWGGLLEIDAFKNLPQADRIRISNTINIEMSGMDDLGNKKPQKGKKAGC